MSTQRLIPNAKCHDQTQINTSHTFCDVKALQNTHSLSQPHVICQHCAHAVCEHGNQPLDTLQLVLEQDAFEVRKQSLLQMKQESTALKSVACFAAHLKVTRVESKLSTLHCKGTRFERIKAAVLVTPMILTTYHTYKGKRSVSLCWRKQLEQQSTGECIVNLCSSPSSHKRTPIAHNHTCMTPNI